MSNPYLWPRIAAPGPDLRASDAERERTAERLRTSHAEGRLDMAEFQQRVERSLEAKTLGELDELVKDLPRRNEQDEGRSFGWSPPLPSRLLRLAPILIALIIVAAAAGHHFFWLWIPLMFVLWRMSWGWRRRRWAGAWRGPDDLT
jgi:hypothetical protein